MSQLTTHILDTTKGKPAPGIHIILYNHKKEEWIEITKGVTNSDGRIPDLLKKGVVMELGMYKLRFETQGYFSKQSIQRFTLLLKLPSRSPRKSIIMFHYC